ncbi:hypothetical protein GCM10027073_20410 [Streptomyces chlorus]
MRFSHKESSKKAVEASQMAKEAAQKAAEETAAAKDDSKKAAVKAKQAARSSPSGPTSSGPANCRGCLLRVSRDRRHVRDVLRGVTPAGAGSERPARCAGASSGKPSR